jgi:uncharacterized cupin superfamily protein
MICHHDVTNNTAKAAVSLKVGLEKEREGINFWRREQFMRYVVTT